MTVSTGQILTVDTVPKYLVDKWSSIIQDSNINYNDDLKDITLTDEKDIQVTAIQGGNVNYAFCITLPNQRTIFLKQVIYRCCCVSME
jgi:hypothetical protein